MRRDRQLAALGAVSLLVLLCIFPRLEAHSSKLTFLTSRHRSPLVASKSTSFLLQTRGGASTIDLDEDEYNSEEEEEEEEEEDYFEDEYDEEEEEDIPLAKSVSAATLTKSAKKATAKVSKKKVAEAKKTVSASLSKTKKPKGPSIVKRYVPYIVRACLNPVTLVMMTKAYFQSLFNLNFPEKEASQDLRSALEEKAKKSGSAGGARKGKRAMRPGQAKTLSDLPQLSA